MNPLRLFAFAMPLAVAACALPSQPVEVSGKGGSPTFEQDHAAILAMTGDYKVNFAFDETVPLRAGYQLHPQHRSSGHEFVAVLEDSGARVVLQHILVSEKGEVTKHWRQDWEFQQTRLWEYVGDNRWQRRELTPAAVQGQWAQTVWQVDDSPRYAGTGRWTHVDGVSSWTSEQEWRPLPRRELTSRSDYDKLVGTNRVTITPAGWVYEQDNLKIDRKAPMGQQVLVREAGIETYNHVSGYDFAAGHAYWSRTQDYWKTVRAAWADLFARNSAIELKPKVDNERLFEAMLQQADSFADKGVAAAQMRAAIDATLQRYLVTSGVAVSSRAPERAP